MMIIAIPLAIIVLLSPSLRRFHGCAKVCLCLAGCMLVFVLWQLLSPQTYPPMPLY